MCGIAGKICLDNSDYIDAVKAMCLKIAHRGPDGEGITIIDNCILGHRRLSIIDLSEKGNQPMADIEKRYFIVFNGEIYNFQLLKNELIAKGYHFESNSDTEVILRAYAEYGTECFKKFEGMFALAIWDTQKRKLIAARDHFGKKPFFYGYDRDGNLTFCSEVNGLKADTNIDFEINMEALNCYLALGYILNPMTMYKGIYQVPAGTYMEFDHKGQLISSSVFWNYADYFHTKTSESKSSIIDNIRHLFIEAVKKRMISDVPVGAFLSGGIDSSSVATILKKHYLNELHTFSVGFKEKSYNELPDAERLAKLIGTFHHSIICDPIDIESLLDEAAETGDQLFADNSIIPMIEVSKLASKYVKVVLSGDGADEIFAGYITYKADKYYKYSQLIPKSLRKMLAAQKIGFVKDSGNKIGKGYKQKQFFTGSLHDYKRAHYSWRLFYSPEERIKIIGEQHRQLVYDTDPFFTFDKYYNDVKGVSILDQHLYVDSKTWLTDDILVKADRSTMHSGLEARCPYLDVQLVQYVASIPDSLKLHGSVTKYILKESLKGILPDFVLNKKKSGFNAPLGSWLGVDSSHEFKAYNKYIYDKFLNNKLAIHE